MGVSSWCLYVTWLTKGPCICAAFTYAYALGYTGEDMARKFACHSLGEGRTRCTLIPGTLKPGQTIAPFDGFLLAFTARFFTRMP